MQVEEAVAHCTSCQRRISELEKMVEALQEQVKQFSRKFDESRAENSELRAENNELKTQNNKLKTRIDMMREEMQWERLIVINFVSQTLKLETRTCNFTLVCHLLECSTIYLTLLAPTEQGVI